MGNSDEDISVSSSHVDHIPLIWITPDKQQQSTRFATWLPSGMGKKEDTLPRLQQLARAGFVAISFDPWQHGERGTWESVEQMFAQAMGNFRHTVWPILGQSALDTLRVIDWAIAEFDSSPPCYMGASRSAGTSLLRRPASTPALAASVRSLLRQIGVGPACTLGAN
jgi:hypothetical protein